MPTPKNKPAVTPPAGPGKNARTADVVPAKPIEIVHQPQPMEIGEAVRKVLRQETLTGGILHRAAAYNSGVVNMNALADRVAAALHQSTAQPHVFARQCLDEASRAKRALASERNRHKTAKRKLDAETHRQKVTYGNWEAAQRRIAQMEAAATANAEERQRLQTALARVEAERDEKDRLRCLAERGRNQMVTEAGELQQQLIARLEEFGQAKARIGSLENAVQVARAEADEAVGRCIGLQVGVRFWKAQAKESQQKIVQAQDALAVSNNAFDAVTEERDEARHTIRDLEQQRATLQRCVNERDADLAEVRAGRERERREYLEARGVHDKEVLAANERAFHSDHEAAGYQTAWQTEIALRQAVEAELGVAKKAVQYYAGLLREDRTRRRELALAMQELRGQFKGVVAENAHLTRARQGDQEAYIRAQHSIETDAQAKVEQMAECMARSVIMSGEAKAEAEKYKCQVQEIVNDLAPAIRARHEAEANLEAAVQERDALDAERFRQTMRANAATIKHEAAESALRTSEAHADQLLRELADTRDNRDFYQSDAALWRERFQSRHSAVLLLLATLNLVVDRERNLRIYLDSTVSRLQSAGQPEIAGVYRTVRAIIFPMHGECDFLAPPQG